MFLRSPIALTVLLAACSGGGSGPEGVTEEQARWISLLEQDPVELDIAKDSRGGAEPPDEIALAGPWKYAGKTRAGMHKWTTPIPIRPRGLFFHNAEPGIRLTNRDGVDLDYARFGKRADEFWSHNRKVILLYRPEKGAPPAAGDYTFAYPLATERERALNLAFQEEGTHPVDFFRTSIHHDWNTRNGLLLPAPARAVWELDMPPAAELVMAPGLSEPELLDGPGSDGATLIVSVEAGGKTSEAGRFALEPGAFPLVKLDLSAWSNQPVKLIFTVDPGATPAFDYAFVGDPMVSSKKKNPRRVVMVFIDTLRADHLGLYGYKRDTSLKLDRWAKGAAVFENARSVAPWTLPSGRAIVTGRHPEYYYTTESVQSVLRGEGFTSAMIAGNVYLSTNFDMAKDWGWHTVGMWPRAETITDDALAYLEAVEGHDAILQVHYMDPHLPYLEPKAYRKLYAGESVAGLGEEFYLPDVRRARQNDKAMQQYVIDRYDNNVRYATDEVSRLLSHLDDNDIVLVYADHGEEFWDHGGFEHGHQLYDELLRVPLIVKAPGVTGTRVAEPAQLTDLTPTILDALGIQDEEERDGISLLPAARGEPADALAQRSLAFGRPLYGEERWGVLTEQDGDWTKWMTHDGNQEAYDVLADPGETKNTLAGHPPSAGAPYHQALGEALHTEAGFAYRLLATHTRAKLDQDLIVDVFVPGGIKKTWVQHDPVGRSFAEMVALSDVPNPDDPNGKRGDRVLACWPRTSGGGGTIWMVPREDFASTTPDLALVAAYGEQVSAIEIPGNRPVGPDDARGWLANAALGGRTIRFGYGIGIVPPEGSQGVIATNDEMSAELAAIGYVHDDGEGGPEGTEIETCTKLREAVEVAQASDAQNEDDAGE